MPPGGGPGAAAVQNSTMLTVVMVISFCETHLIPMGHFHFRYHFRDVGRVCGDQTQQAHGGFEIYIYIRDLSFTLQFLLYGARLPVDPRRLVQAQPPIGPIPAYPAKLKLPPGLWSVLSDSLLQPLSCSAFVCQ